MDLLFRINIFCLISSFIGAIPDKEESKFITDFILNKNVMVTAHFCWKYEKVSKFLKHLISIPKLKETAIYNNSTDQNLFFRHKSADNYFLIDVDNCETSWKLLETANEAKLFRSPLKYLILTSANNFNGRLQKALSNYTIYPSSDVVVAKRIEPHEFGLFQPYRIDKFNNITWESYGQWTSAIGLIDFPKLANPERRKNLVRSKISVALHMDTTETWKHLEDFRFPRIDTFTKQNFGSIKALAEYCDFHPLWQRATNYGYFNNQTKQWSGIVRLLQEHKIDLSGSSPYFTAARFQVVDFIKMQNPLQIRFLLKKPPLSNIVNIFTLPFQTNVWIVLSIFCSLFCIIMYLTMNWESKTIYNVHNRQLFTISDIILILLEGVCQQGTVMESKKAAGRILQFFTFLCFMFLYVSFSAYIIVLLQSSVTILNLKQLLNSGMGVGGMNTSYMAVYLSGSKNPIHQQIYKTRIGPKGYYALEVGMAKVQSGFFALHTEISPGYDYILEKFTNYEICGFQELEGFNEHLQGYTMVPKNSHYKDIFKVGLMKIDEFGIQRRNYLRYLRVPKCYSGGGNFVSVGIIDMYQALMIWGYGTAFGILIFLIEIFVNHKMKKKKFSTSLANYQSKKQDIYRNENKFAI